MKKNLIKLLTVLLLILPIIALANDPVRISKAERKMAEAISAKDLRDYLYFIASDAMGGRKTPSRGLDITGQFLSLNLKRWGFKPAGDNGTFYQNMKFRKTRRDPANIELKIDEEVLEYNKDFYLVRGNGQVNGGMVFGSHGWMVKSKGIDAFKELDINGKIVVIYSDKSSSIEVPAMPETIKSSDLKGKKGVDWADPVTYAKQKGAKGLIIVPNRRIQGFWKGLKKVYSGSDDYNLVLPDKDKEGSLPVILVSRAAAKSIFAKHGSYETALKGFDLNSKVEVNAKGAYRETYARNVIALWEGSDPKLKAEMVAIGCHYDHLGTDPKTKGDDKIFNGADDDGSGTVAVLSIAEALAKSGKRPKRSILLIWHAGEELGLLGSQFFNDYPTVKKRDIVTYLNLDMIGRSERANAISDDSQLSGENEIYLMAADLMSSELGRVVKETNASYLNMNYNSKFDDEGNQFINRSDQYPYLLSGIPVAVWFSGLHGDYHGVGDHAGKIDYQKLEKLTRTVFLTAWELAQLKTRPAVDKNHQFQ